MHCWPRGAHTHSMPMTQWGLRTNPNNWTTWCYFWPQLISRNVFEIRSIFIFLLFLIKEENVSYQELFLKWKNIVPSQSYRIFKSRKYIQLHYMCEIWNMAVIVCKGIKQIFDLGPEGKILNFEICSWPFFVFCH